MVKYTQKKNQKGSGIRSRIKKFFNRKKKTPTADSISRKQLASKIVNSTEKKSKLLDRIFVSLCKKKAAKYLKDPNKEDSGILYTACSKIYKDLFIKLKNASGISDSEAKALIEQGFNNTAINTELDQPDESQILLEKTAQELEKLSRDNYMTTVNTKEDLNNLLIGINPYIEKKINSMNKPSQDLTEMQDEYDIVKGIIIKIDNILNKFTEKSMNNTLHDNIDDYAVLKARFESLEKKEKLFKSARKGEPFGNNSPFFKQPLPKPSTPKPSTPKPSTPSPQKKIRLAFMDLQTVISGLPHVTRRVENLEKNPERKQDLEGYLVKHINNFKTIIKKVEPVLSVSSNVMEKQEFFATKQAVIDLCNRVKIADIDCNF